MKYETTDFHLHTACSECCLDKTNTTVANLIARADELGYETIGITDHSYLSGAEDWKMIKQARAEIKNAKGKHHVHALLSAEVEMMPEGALRMDRELAAQLDYILVASSHFHFLGKENPNHYSPRQAAEIMLHYFQKAIETGVADIIAHPLLNLYNALGSLDEIVTSMKDDEILSVLKMAGQKKIAVDMNIGLFENSWWVPRKERERGGILWGPEGQVRFYRLCKEAGVKIAAASDAHSLEHFGATRLLKPWVREIGLNDDDFIDYDWIRKNKHFN